MKRVTADRDIAFMVGYNAAFVLEYIQYFVNANKMKGNNFIHGRYWTYSTIKDIAYNLKVLSPSQIKTAMKALVKNDLIIKGNFNKYGYDKTTWYTLTDKALNILNNASYALPKENLADVCDSHISPVQEIESANPMDKFRQPIPNTETIKKLDISAQKKVFCVSQNKKEFDDYFNDIISRYYCCFEDSDDFDEEYRKNVERTFKGIFRRLGARMNIKIIYKIIIVVMDEVAYNMSFYEAKEVLGVIVDIINIIDTCGGNLSKIKSKLKQSTCARVINRLATEEDITLNWGEKFSE